MKETINTKRLIKVAKELNVGTSTIVEYLNNKGFVIDSNPNSKISDDQYFLLMKEYGAEKNLKNESQKISIQKKNEKKESISINDIEIDNKNDDDDDEDNNEQIIHIKDSNVLNNQLKTDNKKEVKVIGKINLDKFNKKNTKVEPDKKIKKEIILKKNLNEVKSEEKTLPEIKKEKIIITSKSEEKTIKINKIIEKKEEHILISKQNKIEEESKLDEIKVDIDEIENKSNFRANELENEIKVVGKIDLNLINQKTRPAKKTRKQKEDERKERERVKKELVVKKPKFNPKQSLLIDDDVEDEVFHTIVKKLDGPTVIGKIDLPFDGDRKKKVIIKKSEVDENLKNKKRKRKRINKELIDVNFNEVPVEKEVDGSDNKKKAVLVKKPILKAKLKKEPIKLKKKKAKTDTDDKDIQKQVKETLARLTTKTKNKAAKYRRTKRDEVRTKIEKEQEEKEISEKILQVTEFITANELSSMMDVHVNQIISICMDLGLPIGINQRLDKEKISLLADEFGFNVEFLEDKHDLEEIEEDLIDDTDNLIKRPPIVTVMGHVDHGKTSLLDYVRKTNVIAGEAGGITQHIGAYNVLLNDGEKITFLDTPGHEAFTAMRARGAKITDIAIIVIAADDTIMPQTIEAINHAQAANVPIVFAINKVDKNGANAEKIKEGLANMNLLVEDWGGKYGSVDISAKFGKNVDKLLERVLLEAEMLELKANPIRNAKGTIIDASLDKGKGYVSTVLVQSGTLKSGDFVLAGQYYGKVKAMYNERNKKILIATPSEPALILGLNGAPVAGDTFIVLKNEREAKERANYRQQIQREMSLKAQKHLTLDEIGRRIAIGEYQEINLIVKGDVVGSIEALADSLIKLSTNEIKVIVRHKAVGQISESDVMLASASKCVIIGFQVRPSLSARRLAEKEDIEIRHYSIIYDAINDLKDAMEGMLSPEMKEEILGTAEIVNVFNISKVGNIAGCIVKEGKIMRDSKVRVIRDGIVTFTGNLGTLKRFKDEVKEVLKGFECGMNIDKYNDIKEGDLIEAFHMKEYKKTL